MQALPPIVWRTVAPWKIGLRLAGLLLPPVLGLTGSIGALRGGKRGSAIGRRSLPVLLGALALINWIVLVCFIASEKVGAGTNQRLSPWAPTFLGFTLLSLVISVRSSAFRRTFMAANLLLSLMWFDTGYMPEHWLDRVDFGSVTVDGKRVPATVYIGNPRLSEAEAIALVHVPRVGNYFFDFGSETFREARPREVLVLRLGAWTWKPMTQGSFRPPLSFPKLNECRIAMSDGRVMTLDF